MFLMWLGEQITARGVGNGISLIIFAGIVAGLPSAIIGLFELARTGALAAPLLLALLVLMLAVVAAIVFMERAQRRLLIQYPEATSRQSDVPGRGVAPAVEAQYGRRHSADLRVVAAAAADHGGAVQSGRWDGSGVAQRSRRGAWPRPAAAYPDLCGDDHLLRVLLHGGRVQCEGHRGQPAQVRRLSARASVRARRPPSTSTTC